MRVFGILVDPEISRLTKIVMAGGLPKKYFGENRASILGPGLLSALQKLE
jgi:hypothetical protein